MSFQQIRGLAVLIRRRLFFDEHGKRQPEERAVRNDDQACVLRDERCRRGIPDMRALGNGHHAACIKTGETIMEPA